MALRWTYRWELHHLLELCGFAIEAEHSDFYGAPPAYGKELIIIARRETNPRKEWLVHVGFLSPSPIQLA
jgi:hypothetical protein